MHVMDGDRAIFRIYGFGILLGSVSANNVDQARRLWGSLPDQMHWKDLKAEEIMRS